MDFKAQKKFDYTDINNFLPDNFMTGTAEYYQNKFGNKQVPRALLYTYGNTNTT